MATKKRVARKHPGDGDFWAFEVPGGFGFLRVRNSASAVCSVYGRVFSTVRTPLSEVAETPIAFNVTCQVDADDSFCHVGTEPLPADLREPVLFWRRIVGDGDHVKLVSSDGTSTDAPIDEARGLETDGGYGHAELAERLIAWIEQRDPTPAENERLLREKPWT
jgi:hypothetical protein